MSRPLVDNHDVAQGTAPKAAPSTDSNWADLVDWHLHEGTGPLYERLCALLREQIIVGALPPRTRMPSTRQLVDRLGVSRTTVIAAYEQLHLDGFVVSRAGSGTYVADGVPSKMDREALAVEPHPTETARAVRGTLSARGQRYQEAEVNYLSPPNLPFNTGMVRIDGRSAAQWQKLVRRNIVADPLFQGYRDAQDNETLRKEIAQYLGISRGVRCVADQVILVAGAQHGIDLSIKVLLDPGARVWVEDPGYPLTKMSLSTAGMDLCHVPVDLDGLRVDEGIAKSPEAKAVFVTPSHQYPMGVALSLPRRLQLLEWAAQRGSWIVEDDYDSEFCYGDSLPALQGLDRGESVIYIGSFSKVLQPAIRTGYVIVPPSLVKAFRAARFLADRYSPLFLEKVLTEFIQQGHFVSHIHRMKFQYGEARDLMVDLLSTKLGRWLEVMRPNQGLHLAAYLHHGLDDRRVAEEARKVDVIVRPISAMYSPDGPARSGLMFGFAGFTRQSMESAVNRLGQVLIACESTRP